MKKNKHSRSLGRLIIKRILLLCLLVGLFFSSMYGARCFFTKVCGNVVIDKFVRHDVTILMPKGALEVEVANTKASRELGLSGRPKMKDSEGLLFVFDKPGRYGFWMKDMNFPLDIVWINQNGIVVDIERNVSPKTFPQTFINESDANFVLEVNEGVAAKFGLYLGSKIRIVE